MPPRPERPADADYYERDRVELFSQGDLFRDVPLAYPLPADELVVDQEVGGRSRRFLSGPLEFGPAMLITPSCSLAAQGAAGYGHPVRTLVPAIPLAELVERGVIKETALSDLRRFDHLINYMYLPALENKELEFSIRDAGSIPAASIFPPGSVSLAAFVEPRPRQPKLSERVMLDQRQDVCSGHGTGSGSTRLRCVNARPGHSSTPARLSRAVSGGQSQRSRSPCAGARIAS